MTRAQQWLAQLEANVAAHLAHEIDDREFHRRMSLTWDAIAAHRLGIEGGDPRIEKQVLALWRARSGPPGAALRRRRK